ncbi:MAG: ral secretion pathway protein GspG [Betaproteobacteria bacterium]|nr:ral secretion pathway protein GspG [Betaproteobacteria bacterium]
MSRAHRHAYAGNGFTYIELVVTVAIVAILAAGALPMVEIAARRHKELELRAALRELRAGLDQYRKAYDEGRIARRTNESGYPPSLQALVDGVEDAKSATKKRIYFMRRLPRDPFFREPASSAAATWGKRSYSSGPDAPQEGEDVFDVYSLSPEAGLNGVPYRDW